MAPPIAPARKACPPRSMSGAMRCGTDSAMNGVSPTAISTSALSGTKSKKEKTTSEAAAPEPNCSTTLHFT